MGRQLLSFASTGGTGHFRIDHVPPGTHVLHVQGFENGPFELRQVQVDSGRATSVGTLAVPTKLAHEVWLGCKGLATKDAMTTTCFTGREIVAPRVRRGAGIIRSSKTWRMLWKPATDRDTAEVRLQRDQLIDWHHEMVVLVSLGDELFDAAGGDPTRIDRVVEIADSIEVLVGPDSLRRRLPASQAIDASQSRPSAVVVPVSSARPAFRYVAAVADQIEGVDWDRIARRKN